MCIRDRIGGVPGRGQLGHGPAAGGEEEVRIALDAQALAVAAGQPGPTHPGPGAVLLRPDVRRLERLHRHRPQAHLRRGPGVGIALTGPAAEPLRTPQTPAQRHRHPQPRQRDAPVALGVDGHLQTQPGAFGRPAVDGAQRQIRGGRGDAGADHQGAGAGLDGIDAMPHPVQSDPPPLLCRMRPRKPGRALVVVRRRPPHVHEGTGELNAVQIAERARRGIEGARTEDDHIALAAARGRRGAVRGIGQGERGGRQLAPGDLVAGVRPGCVRGEHRRHRPPGFPGVALPHRRRRQLQIRRFPGCQGRHRQPSRSAPQARHLVAPAEVQMPQIGEVVEIGDPDPARPVVPAGQRLDPYRLDDLLELHQAGGGRPVGEDQPVADEVAVVQFLAEVAAVGVEHLAVGRQPAQPVVDPFPDEAALTAVVSLEQPLVLAQTARSVAHRMGVLAEDEGQLTPPGVQLRVGQRLLGAPSDAFHLGVAGVHPGVHIGVRAGAVALVVQRPGRIALAHPGGHGGQPAAGAALVAQRPQHDAGVVLVPLDHPPGPVQQRRLPACVVGRIAPPVLPAETVGLQIAFVDHPQPQFVAQVEEGGVRRIVAGAHGVDVVTLHQHQIVAHRLGAERAPVTRVEFMAVDAAQQDPAAVDLQQTVLDADRTEPDPQRDPLARGDQLAVVETGLLRGPGTYGDRCALPGGQVESQLRDGHPPGRCAVHP